MTILLIHWISSQYDNDGNLDLSAGMAAARFYDCSKGTGRDNTNWNDGNTYHHILILTICDDDYTKTGLIR